MAAATQAFDPRQYMKKNTYEVFHYFDASPQEVALHHHDFYEVYFFLSGNVHYTVESRSYLLTAGDLLLIRPMELHRPMFGREQRDYERIVLWIHRDFLEQLCTPERDLAACFDTARPGRTNLLRPDGDMRLTLNFLLEALIQESASEEFGSEIYGVSCLVQVLVLLNRQSRREQREAETRTGADSVVYAVLNYINAHYSEDLSLDFLANRFFVSKYHLSREFNRLVGTSVYRYTIQKRLVMAKELMRRGVSSTAACQQCGFGDYSNFYRAFRAQYQISPKAFIASQPEAESRYREGTSLRDDKGEK